MIDGSMLYLLVVIGSVLLSMTFHEAMHAFASYWLGDDTAKFEGRLTLNPIKHIDPFLTLALPLLLAFTGGPVFGAAKPVPFNPNRVKWDEFGAALVGIAGPLTNIVLAIFGAGLIHLLGLDRGDLSYKILATFSAVNIGFFAFNMIPWPPLDGSRLLYAFAPEPVQRFMQQIESFGISGIFIFMFLLFPAISPILYEVNRSILNFLGIFP